MPTREELLRGIVRMNNERIDVESLKARDASEVQRAASERGDEPAREPRTYAEANQDSVPSPKESVYEFAARREREIRKSLQEIADREAQLKAELEGLSMEAARLCEEQTLLFPLLKKEEVNDDTSRSNSTVSRADEGVPENPKGGGNRRRRGVRGKGNGGNPGAKKKEPPTSSR